MRPDLVFARMTARAAQWDTAPGGAQIGGRVLDAALAGGMPRKLWLAGRMRYCLDTSVTLELERLLMVKLTLIALEEGYKRPPGMKPGEPWLRKLSSLAILEEMTPAGCPATLANGTRVLLPWHQKTRALVVDVPLRSWYRHWSRPYGAIVSVLTGWHESAYAYIRKQSES